MSLFPCCTSRRTHGSKPVLVVISGLMMLDSRPDQEELVLNNVVEIAVQYIQEVMDGKWGSDCALSKAVAVHSSQGVTIIDDYLQWSNLAYLAVSRVKYMRQLKRVVCPPEEGFEEKKNHEQAVATKRDSKEASWQQVPR